MNEAPGAAEMEAVLGALLPPGVAVAVWSSALEGDVLGPRERVAVARAVRKRQEEFARGRACAREALRRAGYGADVPGVSGGGPHSPDAGLVEIPVGASREPVWPEGFTGSITHCEGFVAAVAGPFVAVRGIGLDGEVDRPLPDEVVGQVITREEASDPYESGHDQVLRFSAKESIHKALFPLTGVWLDFLDVALELEPEPGGAAVELGRFRARPASVARTEVPEVEVLKGRYARVGGLVVTASWL